MLSSSNLLEKFDNSSSINIEHCPFPSKKALCTESEIRVLLLSPSIIILSITMYTCFFSILKLSDIKELIL